MDGVDVWERGETSSEVQKNEDSCVFWYLNSNDPILLSRLTTYWEEKMNNLLNIACEFYIMSQGLTLLLKWFPGIVHLWRKNLYEDTLPEDGQKNAS